MAKRIIDQFEVIEVDKAAVGAAVGDRVIVKMRHGAYADEAVVTPSQTTSTGTCGSPR
mgnify:CR=1 FL=1